jgi:hypothetical protein
MIDGQDVARLVERFDLATEGARAPSCWRSRQLARDCTAKRHGSFSGGRLLHGRVGSAPRLSN